MKDRIAEWTEATIAFWVTSAPEIIWRNIWFEVCEESSYEKIADARCLKILMSITEYCVQDCIFSKKYLHGALTRHYRESDVTNNKLINLLVDDEGKGKKHDSGFGWFTSRTGAAVLKDYGYGKDSGKTCPQSLSSRVRGRTSYVMCKDDTAEDNLKALRKALFETHAFAVSERFREKMRAYLVKSAEEGAALRCYEDFEIRSIAVLNADQDDSCQRMVTEEIRRQLARHKYRAAPGRNMVEIRELEAPVAELVWTRGQVGARPDLPPILYKKEIEHSLAREAQAG